MPQQAAVQGENNFVMGLITETTALRFPPNACTDTDNCVFDETGRVTRRLGLDIEDAAVLTSTSIDEDEAFTEFVWEGVAGDGSRSFVVQQKGDTLSFYDISNSNSVSDNNTAITIDLDTFLASGSSEDPATFPCQYAQGIGRLIVVNPACDPFYLDYDAAAQTMTGTAIDIKVRDFAGLNSGLGDSDRTTSTVAALITANPYHYYNLLNQGYFSGDALSQWDSARTDLPSNQDYVALYRSTATDAFDNARVTSTTPGNRLASKGHFILNAWCPDRTQALTDEGFTATITNVGVVLNATNGTSYPRIGDLINDPGVTAAFDGQTSETQANSATKSSATTGYAGINLAPSALAVTQVKIYGSNNAGFVSAANPNVTLTLYGKQGAAPANSTDGTSLGTTTFADTADESAGHTITSSDQATFWDYVWVKIDHDGAAATIGIAEITIYVATTNDELYCTPARPQCIEFFAGRAWYAGVAFGKLATNIYFTQIVEKVAQFERCYQANDPASEDFTDLLPDDGGIIKIPEIAEVKKLFAFQNILLVIATNGIWTISGGSQGGFLATDFSVRKISAVGSRSPLSVMSVKGSPAWWAEDGIWTVQLDPQNNSFQVISLTDEKIRSVITSIPPFNRQFVKACYNTTDGTGGWLVNDADTLDTADYYTYNRVLVINGLNGAFYPWSFSSEDAVVRGCIYVNTPNDTVPGAIKFTTTIPIDASNEYLTWSETYNSNYLDWGLLANRLNDQSYVTDYTSYFITGFRLDGQAFKYFQPRYVYVFHEFGDCVSSCFMQGIFDFTNSGDSGKWSSLQQVFRPQQNHRFVSVSRLKVRGRGRSLQLRFVSESGKPFQLIGWAIPELINADL